MVKSKKNMGNKSKCVVIGGGPSGIIAAISAARDGYGVTLLEKKSELGKKIIVSGNGRCNLSNTEVSWENYHGKHPKFVASVMSRVSEKDTIQFFHSLGLETKIEDKGRIFPISDQSESVLDVLLFELESLKVKVLYKSKVTQIKKEGSSFFIKLFNGKMMRAEKVIIATGGKTYPSFGSTGDGYGFAKNFGHTIEEVYPVSSGVEVSPLYKPLVNKLQGVKVEAGVTAMDGERELSKDLGTVLFTHFGLSAWAIMRLSYEISRAINIEKRSNIEVLIDFFPQYDKNTLSEIIEKRWKINPQKTLAFSFVGMMQKKLASTLLDFAGYDITKKVALISKKDRLAIVDLFKKYHFEIISVKDWEEAQFTMGGVSVEEINPINMESRIVPGLHFCGEVVDITGDSGGYNLQWAWSSGYLAGSRTKISK